MLLVKISPLKNGVFWPLLDTYEFICVNSFKQILPCTVMLFLQNL